MKSNATQGVRIMRMGRGSKEGKPAPSMYLFAVLIGFVLVGCATAERPQTATDDRERSFARIALIDAHPFDLKGLIEGKGAPYLAAFLLMADAIDTNRIDTNYDTTKSLVTVIAGDYPSGGTLLLDFVQVTNKRSKYTISSSFRPSSKGSPSIVINSYRIARSADIDVTARVNGQVIAFKHFRAEGPPDKPQSGWPLLAGDTELGIEELRTTLVGTTFFVETEGTIKFGAEGNYARVRSHGTFTGTYEIRADGLTCIKSKNGRKRCYNIVRDARGNVTLIDDRSRRFRMEPT